MNTIALATRGYVSPNTGTSVQRNYLHVTNEFLITTQQKELSLYPVYTKLYLKRPTKVELSTISKKLKIKGVIK